VWNVIASGLGVNDKKDLRSKGFALEAKVFNPDAKPAYTLAALTLTPSQQIF
jgi:hypothetical protein